MADMAISKDRKRRLGEIVAHERARLRMSQQEFANRAKLSMRTVSNVEQGLISGRPSDKTKRGIEEALGWAEGDFVRVLGGGEPSEHGEVVTERDADELWVYRRIAGATPEGWRKIRDFIERNL
jgi:transcriptional regulator with XRE-family HTH domain